MKRESNNMRIEPGEILLKPREAARMLGIHVLTLWRWAKTGRIRAVRTPTGRYLYPLSEIKRILGQLPSENAVLYVRVLQRDPSSEARIKRQLEAMRKYAEEKKIKVSQEIIDVGPLRSDSPGFRKLIELLRARKVGYIIIPRKDVFGPLCADVIISLIENLTGVRVISLNMSDPELVQERDLETMEVLISLLRSRREELIRRLLASS